MSVDAGSRADADPQDMLGTVEASPDQWRAALELALDGPAPRTLEGPVVVLGMGGSGIAGDVAALVADERGQVPVIPVKGYELPRWVGDSTTVVAVSYSGNTEETLAAVDVAAAAGASVLAVTSGGALGERAASDGWPVVGIPGGQQPRASLPFLTVPVLVALERAGAWTGVIDALQGIGSHLERCRADWRSERTDSVVQLAEGLVGRVPVWYGGRGVPALVAHRAKCQVNENAALPSFANELPELDHNEVVGWETPSDLTRVFACVQLRSDDEHPQVRRRIGATLDLVGDAFAEVHEHRLTGADPLARLAAGVLFVDLVSVHLALRTGTDPTPVRVIEELKRRITDRGGQDA